MSEPLRFPTQLERPFSMLLDDWHEPLVKSSLALEEWARRAFVDSGAPLENPDHEHLQAARIGMLWTRATYRKGGRIVLGTAEIPRPPAASNAWQKARWEQQILDWFGEKPNFIVTLSAPFCDELDDLGFCAVMEHELYHCGQLHRDGIPQFSRSTGRPLFSMRGHDVEEHLGVVRRYGAWSGDVREMAHAAQQAPSIGLARIAAVCGTCARGAA